MDEDIRVLISQDGQKKIVCYRYMEECFHNEGFSLLTNSKNNLLNKFFNIKILNKIKTLFLLILRSKFYFSNPKNNKIVIFDCETTKDIEKVLPNKNYAILSTRIKKINKIYLSWKIIFYVLKNLLNRSLKQNYLVAVIKAIAPKIVLTHVSHSEDFHIVSKILHSEIKFIAIQSATSNEITFMPETYKKNYFIPTLFCFGEYDKIFYKKEKINVESIEAIGSIKSSLSYEYVKSKKIEINPNQYDICLVSEPHAVLNGDFPQVKNMAECCGLVAEFTHRLCKKHNLNLIFSGASEVGSVSAMREFYFYKHYLKNYNFKIFNSSNRESSYPSYVNVMKSKLAIGSVSTLLREVISFEKKILSCMFTGHSDVGFPARDSEFSDQSICILKEPSYELFEQRVLKILSMTQEEYFSQLGKDKSFIMAPTTDTANILRKKINSYS